MNRIQRIAIELGLSDYSCRSSFPLHRYAKAWIPSSLRWQRRIAARQAESNPSTTQATFGPMASRP